MSRAIPDTNLPIYFQDFSVVVSDGEVHYTTVGLIPSNRALKRVASLVLQGNLRPSSSCKYTVILDFSNVAAVGSVVLEGPLSGYVTIGRCGIKDAARCMSYDASRLATERILVLVLRARVVDDMPFYISITINDTSCTCPTPAITLNDILWEPTTECDFQNSNGKVNAYGGAETGYEMYEIAFNPYPLCVSSSTCYSRTELLFEIVISKIPETDPPTPFVVNILISQLGTYESTIVKITNVVMSGSIQVQIVFQDSSTQQQLGATLVLTIEDDETQTVIVPFSSSSVA